MELLPSSLVVRQQTPNLVTKLIDFWRFFHQSRNLVKQLSRFILVGSLVAIVQFSILLALVEFFGTDPLSASTVGFLISAIINYLLNYSFTFRSQVPHFKALTRFIFVALSGLILNGVLMRISLDLLTMHYVLAQIISISCVIFWNFFVNRKWTFAAANN